MCAQRRRDIVLNDIAQFDRRQRVFVLDSRFDMDKSLSEGVVALSGVGQKVFEDLSVITVL